MEVLYEFEKIRCVFNVYGRVVHNSGLRRVGR